tara:strand:+ start:1647 stop:2144 length:498 start_codon:yes stop_codon:yes gene_type:complete
MKKLILSKYETKVRDGESSERWGVSMAYPVLLDAFDDHLASMTPEQLTKAGFSTKAEDLKTLGDPAEQALAMQVCTYLTGKISKPNMASKTEAEIREYCSKNFIKIATEAKSTKAKIDEAVQLISNEIVELSMQLITLKFNSPEWVTVKAQIEAYRSVNLGEDSE